MVASGLRSDRVEDRPSAEKAGHGVIDTHVMVLAIEIVLQRFKTLLGKKVRIKGRGDEAIHRFPQQCHGRARLGKMILDAVTKVSPDRPQFGDARRRQPGQRPLDCRSRPDPRRRSVGLRKVDLDIFLGRKIPS